MSIIESLQTYMESYSGLESGAPLWVDYLGKEPTGYSIVPMPGTRVIEKYLNGGSVREFPFMLQSMSSTADDAARLANSGFFETLADWFDSQTNTGALPTLGAKQTALSIEAVNSGYLAEQGESGTGVYAIQCKLTYEQYP